MSIRAGVSIVSAVVVAAVALGLLALGFRPGADRPAATAATTLAIRAKDIRFSTLQLEVAAGAPFRIVLHNDDPVAHDIDIQRLDGSTAVHQPVAGGETAVYEYPSLAPGRYTFICTIHPVPGMTGTLTVK